MREHKGQRMYGYGTGRNWPDREPLGNKQNRRRNSHVGNSMGSNVKAWEFQKETCEEVYGGKAHD